MPVSNTKRDPASTNIASYIKKSASYSFVIKITGLLLGFSIQVVLARTLGVDEFGLYSFVATMVMFISTMTILGLDKSIIRFLPEYTNNNEIDLLSSFVIWSLRKLFLATCIVSALLLIFEPVLASLATPVGGVLLILAVALIIINVPVNYISGVLLAMKKPVLSQFPSSVLKPLIILLSIIIAITIFSVELDAADVITINIIVSIFMLLVYVVFFFRHKSFKIKLENNVYEHKKEWWKTSIGFIGITLCNLIITQTDIMMIGSLLAPKEVALYAVAAKISGLLLFFLASVNAVVAPLISEYYHGSKRDELIKIVGISSKIITISTVFSAIVIIVFSNTILSIFGVEYLIAKDVLIVLCLGHCVNALTGSVSYIMSMTGYQGYVIKILVVSSVINLLLNWILINNFGIIGAAYATAIATIVWNLSMFIVVYKKLNINTTCFSMRRSS